MKTVLSWGSTILVGVLAMSCTTAYTVRPVSSATSPSLTEHAVFYALPRTSIVVEADVVSSGSKPGPCIQELIDPQNQTELESLARTLGAPPASLKQIQPPKLKIDTWRITSVAERDPDRLYAIEVRDHRFRKYIQQLELAEEGFLLTGEAQSQNSAVDLGVKAFSAAAQVVSLFTAGGPAGATQSGCETALEELVGVRGEIRRLVNGTGIAALAGTPPETISAMLLELRKIEAQHLAPFLETKTVKGTIRCTSLPVSRPDRAAASVQTLPLFEIHTDASGTQVVPISAHCRVPRDFSGTGTKAVGFDLHVEPLENSLVQAMEAAVRPPRTEGDGIFYRVPARSRVTVRLNSAPVQQTEMQIAQFGFVNSLLGGSKGRAASVGQKAAFYPGTGGLKSLRHEGAPMDAANITAAGDAIKGLVEARQAANDELAQLERQRKILEEQKKIRELEETLSADDAAPDNTP